MEISDKALHFLTLISEKFSADDQKLESYLEGLLHQKYLDYWDYIKLDTLLSLQEPRTNIPDENIFIIYHQITELFFKLIHLEIDQILGQPNISKDYLILRISRITIYFEQLINSFSIMRIGMEKEQFLQFRMSLLPASGFQSAQYRLIEFKSTQLKNLLHIDKRGIDYTDLDLEEIYSNLYWKFGAIEKETSKKALTLTRFESKYDKEFLDFLKRSKDSNILAIVESNPEFKADTEIIAALRKYDYFANVIWPSAHVGTAGRYLGKGQDAIGATGGTNWQDYLPPRHQQRRFFPFVWTVEEIAIWGSPEIKI